MVFVTPAGFRIQYNDSLWAHDHVLPDLLAAVRCGRLLVEG